MRKARIFTFKDVRMSLKMNRWIVFKFAISC